MRELYHYPLDAYGRIARIYLHEKSLEYQEIEENPWDRKKVFSENHLISDLPTFHVYSTEGFTLSALR